MKSFYEISFLITLSIICPILFGSKINYLFNSNSNDIKIKVKGIGLQKVCSDFKKPDQLYLYDINSELTKIGDYTNEINIEDEEEKTLLLRYNDVINGAGLFSDCTNILEVDLSGCTLTDMASMFKGCTALTSINFSGVNTSSAKDGMNLFNNCKSLISLDLSHIDFTNFYDFRNIFSNCSSLEYINLPNYDESKVEDYYKIVIDENIAKNLIICVDQTKAPSLYSSLSSGLCTVIYCGEDWEKKRLIYDEDLETCLLDNKLDYSFEENLEGFEEENEMEENEEEENEEENYISNEVYEEDIEDTISELIYNNTKLNEEILKDFFIDDIFNNTNNITLMKSIVNKIIESVKAGEFKQFMEENNETELITKQNDAFYHLSTLSSQLYNKEVGSINLGDCEEKLRNSSNIDSNEELIIFKVNHIIPETTTQIIDYTIFTLDGVQLNLDICKDIEIKHIIPINIDEKEIYKYDPNSYFYNDICTQYKTKSGTDLTNYDRKNDFNKKNMALCENNCEFKEYNKDNKKVICNCKIKNIFNTFEEIDKKKLLKKFINFKNVFNLEVVKCYKLLFSKKGLVSNIGSYIIISIIAINFVNLILFWTKGYYLFFNKINSIISFDINNNKQIIINNNDEIRTKSNKAKSAKSKTTKNKINANPPNKRNNNKKSRTHKYKKKNNNNKKTQISVSKEIYISNNNINDISKQEKKDNNNNNNIERNDYEMNCLSYKDAIKYDYRTFSEYYLSLIRTKQLIVFTFFTKTDYNSKIIKINCFFTSFALYYTIKTLFFNDSTMHVIYENNGVYDFIFQLPQILYSTIISLIVGTLLSKLSLTQANIVEIKNSSYDKKCIQFKNEIKRFVKRIRLKFILFFVVNFLLLIIFWYYLSCFCAVYKNTQLYLFIDVLISFGISLIYPFIINLLPCIFRIKSLKQRNDKYKCMYTFSKVLQLI